MPDPLHILFEQCARATPYAPALVYEGSSLSYKQLNQRASQLANHLFLQGIGKGSYVHLYIPRSPDLIIALLAVLKCGAAYVPLETTYPRKRLNFLFDDLQSDCVLSLETLATSLPELTQPVFLLDTMQLDRTSDYSSDVTDINSTCVVLYTSGSTGNPKGVALHHRGLVNRLLWEQRHYDIKGGEVVLQHASVSFDFALWEIFTALINSACLVMPRVDFSYEGSYLAMLIQQHEVTIMGSVPSLLSLLIEEPNFERCTSLKRVMSGGEILTPAFQQRFFERSRADLINIYGPTETSISVLHWHCQRDVKQNKVPIGQPVADMSIYLLDEKMLQVTAGDEGEIYIAGEGVADGYHARETLDQKHFIDDPFYRKSKRKIYRTGDIARQRSDGIYEYIGRKDNQVKIRGLRVELEEIELTLSGCPGIKECVVTAPLNEKDKRRLTAWVVAKSSASLDEGVIRAFLTDRLPAYMVPPLFNHLETLPLTPNGKVDRQALSIKRQEKSVPSELSTSESLIYQLWHEILDLEAPNIDTSFFECGGDSLTCLELSVKIEKELSIRLPLPLLFQNDTIRKQAQIIESGETGEEKPYISTLNPGKKNDSTALVFVSGLDGHFAFVDALRPYLSDHLILNISSPVLNDSTNGISETAAIQCEALLEIGLPNEIVLSGYSLGGLFAYKLAQLLSKNGVRVRQIILLDTGTPETISYFISERGTMQKLIDAMNSLRNRPFSNKFKLIWERVAAIWRRRFMYSHRSPNIAAHLRKRRDQEMSINLKAARYNTLGHYDGDVTLVRARDQLNYPRYESLGWDQYIDGDLNIETVSGSHYSMLNEPYTKEVAEIIKKQLR